MLVSLKHVLGAAVKLLILVLVLLCDSFNVICDEMASTYKAAQFAKVSCLSWGKVLVGLFKL